MDMTWITDRIAVGGAIWDERRMLEVVEAGISHIIDMQIEFDDTLLAEPYFVEVLWNPVDDDFQPKPPELFQRGVDFALRALEDPEAKLLIHCAAGVHRAPMMMLALLRAQGWAWKRPSCASSRGARWPTSPMSTCGAWKTLCGRTRPPNEAPSGPGTQHSAHNTEHFSPARARPASLTRLDSRHRPLHP